MASLVPLWDDPARLDQISGVLQWSAVPLLVAGALLQIAQLMVDKRQKTVEAEIEAKKEQSRFEREAKYQDRLDAREAEVAQLKTEAAELRTSTENLKPFRQPISFASAMIQVFTATRDELLSRAREGEVLSSKSLNGTPAVLRFLDSQGNALLALSTTEVEMGKREPAGMEARSLLTVTPIDAGYGSYIGDLERASKVSIHFNTLKPGDTVLGGHVNVNISHVVDFDLSIPQQVMQGTRLFINDLAPLHLQITAHRK